MFNSTKGMTGVMQQKTEIGCRPGFLWPFLFLSDYLILEPMLLDFCYAV